VLRIDKAKNKVIFVKGRKFSKNLSDEFKPKLKNYSGLEIKITHKGIRLGGGGGLFPV